MGRQRALRRQRKLSQAIGAVCEPVERRMMLSASLVLDGLGRTGSSELGNFVELDDRVIFTGQGYGEDADFGVWSSDGTAAGTYEIHDAIDYPAAPVRMGDEVYFTENGRLYRSDGTPAGTEQIALPDDGYALARQLTVSDDTLYFLALDEAHGTELWKSDGTAAGTAMVKDVTVGPAHSDIGWFVGSDGAIFFKANNTLFHSDGTAAGTQALRSIADITGRGYDAEIVNGTLYFPNIEPATGARLWKSDGTVAGTQVVEDPATRQPRWPMNLTAVGNKLCYTAEWGPGMTRALYQTDGTGYGTDELFGGGGNVADLTPANGRLFFTARSGSGYGTDLWQTTGTSTTIVDANAFGDLDPFQPAPMKADHNALYYLSGGIQTTDGTAPPTTVYTGNTALYPYALTMGFAGSTMLYLADDGVHGMELWKTDGTVAGTQLAVDLGLRYFDYSAPEMFGYTGNAVGGIFVKGGIKGNEPWFTDGTPGGTFLLKDINSYSPGYSPEEVLSINGVTYFSLTNYDSASDTTITELWRSDGTTGGASLVKSFPDGSLSFFTNVNGTLFFNAFDAAHGQELWKSDGTAAGTLMVKDIVTGPNDSSPTYLSAVGGTLYFGADDGLNGQELWKSDGTEAGTVMVKDIVTGSAASYPQPVHALGALGIFGAWEETGERLYRTNGTESGTFLLGDIALDAGRGTAVIGGNLYFIGASAGHGYELWKTNGTVAGTQMVIELGAGEANSEIAWVAAMNDTLYFMRTNGELWSSNGAAAGTSLITTAPGDGGFFPAVVGNLIYFATFDEASGRELWKTNGTAGGTAIVKDIRPGSYGSSPSGFASVGSTLYFVAHDGEHGEELWKSDGTDAGTVQVKDNYPGGFGGVFFIPGTLGNGVIFAGSDGGTQGLFFSDGTADGTHAIGPLSGVTGDSDPYGFTQLPSGQVYFFAFDGLTQQLYRSDGTTGGTVKLTDIPAPSAAGFGGITYFNGDVYFFDGPRMWKVDAASPQGATLVIELPNAGSAMPIGMIEYNGKLFFSHRDLEHDQELWVSDGTEAGTHLFLDINTAPFSGSDPTNFVLHEGLLYFIARDADHGIEIWKTDGTAGGTAPLTDFVQDPWLGPSQLCLAGSTLFFTYFDANNGAELWTSDGTLGGTHRVIDPDPTHPYNTISNVTVAGNRVYFLASDAAHGTELWTSDGAAAGSHIVVDLRPGAASADIRELKVLSDQQTLVFTARDGIHGREVFVSNGTAASTILVDDIAPGAISSAPHGLVEGNGVLAFFAADNADGGRGIWSAPLPNGIFAALGATWSITGPVDAQTLTVTSGTVSLATNIQEHYTNLNINVSGDGHVIFDGGGQLDSLAISAGGRVSVLRGSDALIHINDLDINVAGGGKLDLADSRMIVHNGDAAAIQAYIAASYNFGGWDGVGGIFTSMPDAGPLVGTTTVGILPGESYFGDAFGGPVAATDVLLMYTYAGDLNFDGLVDAADYGYIDNFVQFPGSSGYWNGDFNYDGVIDAGDYGIIDNTIQLQGPPL